MGKKRRGPTFAKRDEKEIAEIEKKQKNGGLSAETLARRRGVNNVFDQFQAMNDRPTLKELCEARDKDGLEADIQGFFQAYYVQIDQPNEVENDMNEELSGDEEENDKFDEAFNPDDEEENDDMSESNDETKNDDNDDNSGLDDEYQNEELTQDEKEVRLRPKGNTSLSYKSHIKQLILGFTCNEFDISNKTQFPDFYVSTIKYLEH
jgi:hypothetical protein